MAEAVTQYFNSEDAAGALHDRWATWQNAAGKRDPEKLRAACVDFVEALASEAATILLSFALTEAPPPAVVLKFEFKPGEKPTFGTHQWVLEHLGELAASPFREALAKAQPDMPSVANVLRQLHNYPTLQRDDDRRAARERLAAPDRRDPDTIQDALVLFNRVRNVYAHMPRSKELDQSSFVTALSGSLHAWATRMQEQFCAVLALHHRASLDVIDEKRIRFTILGNTTPSQTGRMEVPLNTPIGSALVVQAAEAGGMWDRIAPRIEGDALLGALKRVKTRPRVSLPDSALFQSAKKGTLLLVLGPEFGLPEGPNSPSARPLVDRLLSTIQFPEYAAHAEFLLKLVAMHLGAAPVVPTRRSPNQRPQSADLHLVGKLAGIAQKVTAVYGRALSSPTIPVIGSSRTRLPHADCHDVADALKALANWIEAQSDELASESDLGACRISANLEVVAADLSVHGVSLADVEWLTDLVWHALRYDSPFYPDSESLAVQIALNAGGVTGHCRRASASSSALIVERDACNFLLTGWMTRRLGSGELTQGAGVLPDRYRTIARALELSLRSRNSGMGPADVAPVLVVDTNLDQRLCETLCDMGVASAVVYPITVCKRSAWGVRRFPESSLREGESAVGFSAWSQNDDALTSIGNLGERVVIVKPMGALTEDLSALLALATDYVASRCPRAPGTRRERPRLDSATVDTLKELLPPQLSTLTSDDISHRVLLDDVDIVRDAVGRQDSLPPELRRDIYRSTASSHARASWQVFFLADPLRELGRRVRLLADLNLEGVHDDELKPSLHYVPRAEPDSIDKAYLHRAHFSRSIVLLGKSMKDLQECLNSIGGSDAS